MTVWCISSLQFGWFMQLLIVYIKFLSRWLFVSGGNKLVGEIFVQIATLLFLNHNRIEYCWLHKKFIRWKREQFFSRLRRCDWWLLYPRRLVRSKLNKIWYLLYKYLKSYVVLAQVKCEYFVKFFWQRYQCVHYVPRSTNWLIQCSPSNVFMPIK